MARPKTSPVDAPRGARISRTLISSSPDAAHAARDVRHLQARLQPVDMIPVALQVPPYRRAVNGRPAADPTVRNRIEGKRLR